MCLSVRSNLVCFPSQSRENRLWQEGHLAREGQYCLVLIRHYTNINSTQKVKRQNKVVPGSFAILSFYPSFIPFFLNHHLDARFQFYISHSSSVYFFLNYPFISNPEMLLP